MRDLTIRHVLVLARLLEGGARDGFVDVTTASLGRAVGRSQQAASKYLLELEQEKLVERATGARGTSVRVTPRGLSEMERLSGVLRRGLEPSRAVELRGTLVSGMGEGAYYMGLRGYTEQFRARIGYVPFPGTLNVRLAGAADRGAAGRFGPPGGVVIDGFSDGTRTYGWVRCFAAELGRTPCHLIVLERTHHDESIIELISDVCMREAEGLGDGSEVTVRMPA